MAVSTSRLWILLGILMVVIMLVLALIVSTPPQKKPQPDTPPKWNDTPNNVRTDWQNSPSIYVRSTVT